MKYNIIYTFKRTKKINGIIINMQIIKLTITNIVVYFQKMQLYTLQIHGKLLITITKQDLSHSQINNLIFLLQEMKPISWGSLLPLMRLSGRNTNHASLPPSGWEVS